MSGVRQTLITGRGKAFAVINPDFSPMMLQVAASGEGATISGYLSRSKRGKRQWKKRWFVIKGKVLYTYIANEVLCNLT